MLFGWWLPCIWSLNEALNKHLFGTRLLLETTWHIMRGQRDQVNFAGCRCCSLTFSISLFNSSFIISVLRFIGDIRRKKCRRALALHTPIKSRLSSTYCSSILQIGNSRYFQVNTLDTAKFMFLYHNNLLSPHFHNLFMTNSQVHRYDTRTASNYRVHSCRTNIKKFTILYQGPRIWNCLPASVTNLSSFSIFKNKVLEFFFENVPELV